MEAETVQEWILAYSQLPPEEQQRVESYVREHPEFETPLQEARSLGALLEAAGRLSEHPPGEDVLAYYASLAYLPDRPVPEWLQEPLQRFKHAVDEDPVLRAKYERYVARMAEADRSGDAVSQFEQLTGRHLAEPAPHGEAALPRERPARIYQLAQQNWLRWAVAAVLIGTVAYGLLYLAGMSTRSELERLAAFDAEDLEISGYTITMRGAESAFPVESSDAQFLQALEHIRVARSSFLGLFPQYELDELQEAEALLRQVIADPDAGAFLELEAYYLLGKIRLAYGDATGAREALRQVVVGRGRMAPEAVYILEELEQP